MKITEKIEYLLASVIFIFVAHVAYPLDSGLDPEGFIFEKIQTPGVSNTLLEDKDGFIWIGTDLGLWQYNGYEFKSFTHIIPERIDAGMYQDRTGNIWIGTGNGLIRFDPLNGSRTMYRYEIDKPGSISNHVFQYKKYAFCEDSKGRFWIATDNGLNLFNFEEETFTTFNRKNCGLIDNFITAIIPSSDGLLWIATFRGLQKFDPETKEVIHYYPGAPMNMYALCEDYESNLWIGSYLDGLYKLDPRFSEFKEYKHISNDDSTISSNMITHLLMPENEPGLLLIATFDGGLNVLDINTGDINHFIDDSKCEASKGISGNSLAQIIQDRMGSLFILNEHGFLNRMDPNTKRFLTLKSPDVDSVNVPKASLHSVWSDSNGDIWMLAGRNKISKYNSEDNEFLYQYQLPEDMLGLAVVDDNDTIWMASDGYISNVKTADGKIINVIPFEGLRFSGVTDLKDNNILWLGSANSGIIKLEKNKNLIHFLNNDDQSRIKTILAQEENGILWISSFGEGLLKFDTVKEELTDKYNFQDFKTGNPSGFFRDSQNRCWVSFQNDGPALFYPETGLFIYFEEHSGVPWPAKGSSGIIEDDMGVLWIGGNGSGEIIKYEPQTKEIGLYTQSDGVALGTSGSFCQRPVHGDDGAFWFAGMGGVTRFYPDKVKDNEYLPPVFISEITQNGKLLVPDITQFKFPFIELSHDRNYFEFEAVALNYRLSEHNRYRYRLIGRDNNWIESGNRRNGFYSGLTEGMYRLEVMGSNNDGLWSQIPAQLNIYVEPYIPEDSTLISYSEINEGGEFRFKHSSNNIYIEAVELDFSILNKSEIKYKLEGYDEDWQQIFSNRFITYRKLSPGKYIFQIENQRISSLKSITIFISPPFYKSFWFAALIFLFILTIIGIYWRERVKHFRNEQEENRRHMVQEKQLENSRKEAFDARIAAVSERERAVEALQVSEQRNSEILAAMTEGFIVADKSWKITYANERFYQMIGYEANNIKLMKLFDLADDSFVDDLKSFMNDLKEGTKNTFEMTWIKSDRKKLSTLVSASPLFDNDGNYQECFAIITDISKLKEAEDTLLKSQIELLKEKDKLEEVNTTLKVLIKKRDDDIEEEKRRLHMNIKKLVIPYIEKINNCEIDESAAKFLEVINTNLSDIAMKLSEKLKFEYKGFTYSEMQVANLIRDGFETKEIASSLNLSMRTVEFHRANIRKKLGLKGKSVNLRDYLMNIE